MSDPGMTVDRRLFIMLGAATTMLASRPIRAAPPDAPEFAALMDALERLGDQLPLTAAAEQNAYIYRVAAQAMLVPDFPIPAMGALGTTGVEIGPLARTQPPTDMAHGIALVSYRMASGAVLQAHNHPNYSVATIGVEGEATAIHFEVEDGAPPFSSANRFTVQKTAERLLRAGEASTLSPARDNVHTFRAGPRGARFVDLFSVHGRDVGFSYLTIEPEPLARGGDRFEARWAGIRPSGA